MENKSLPVCICKGFSPEAVELKELLAPCRDLYQDQPDPFDFRTLEQYWEGRYFPLSFIRVYFNHGNPASDIAPHWHYIGFGLSGIRGDGTVHEKSGSDIPSRYGFELTFRLKGKPDKNEPPPILPVSLMHQLAIEVFKLKPALCAGSSITYPFPLTESISRIEHFLVFEDPQLGTVKSQFGPVTFLQMVGVCEEELKAALPRNGPHIIEKMKSTKGAGGPWLITDMSRDKTLFELDSSVQAVTLRYWDNFHTFLS